MLKKSKRIPLTRYAFGLMKKDELVALAREVFNCEYVPRQSIAFIVTKPCLREVVAADFRDRIVQHYIVMRLEALSRNAEHSTITCSVAASGKATLRPYRPYNSRYSTSRKVIPPTVMWQNSTCNHSYEHRQTPSYDELVALVAKRYEGWDKDTLLYLSASLRCIIRRTTPCGKLHLRLG